MRRIIPVLFMAVILIFSGACAGSYKAKPLPFKRPAAYPNATEVLGVIVAAQAFAETEEAKGAFGFDIRKAGMLRSRMECTGVRMSHL